MRTTFGIGIAALALTGLLVVPASAPGARQCLYQDERATAGNRARLERSLLCLTNVHRLKNGADPVLLDGRLSAAARAHSADMATRQFFSHTNPDGVDTAGRAAAVGYPGGVSENIATNGKRTPLSLFKQWRDSTAGHNENMLNPGWAAAGMGIDHHFYLGGSPGITGTQMLGSTAADTKEDGLDLYANNKKCARAKLAVIFLRERLRRGKGNRQRLKRGVKQFRKQISRTCKAPPGLKD